MRNKEENIKGATKKIMEKLHTLCEVLKKRDPPPPPLTSHKFQVILGTEIRLTKKHPFFTLINPQNDLF